jgi:HK97 family phage portal protein
VVDISVFNRIFKKSQAKIQTGLISENTAVFTAFNGDAYANDIYRGAVDAIARNVGKLKGSHVTKYADNTKQGNDSKLNRILQVRPNPYMSSYDFLYKMATHYFLYNNSFALLDRMGRNIKGIYPITCAHVDFLSDEMGNLYCKFYLKDGKESIFPYTDIIHLRRNFNRNELLGDDNRALEPALELAHTQNEGIVNGIKSGAHIRGILKFIQIMAPSKLRAAKELFMQDYLQMSNDGGVVATDQQMEYIPIDNKPITLNAEHGKAVQSKIYNYIGITESIVNSSYTEDEFSAFYESTIEPFAVQAGLEFTNKVFNEREQAFGNSILFESGRLQFTSNKTKVNLIKELMPYGLLTINQALEILNLPSVQDGDKRLQTLNVVDADKATKYQLGGTANE